MNKIKLVLILSLAIAGVATAQEQHGAERIEAKKIAFITSSLDLTPHEAQLFWPVFNEHENNVKAITKQYKSDEKPRNMSDEDLEHFIDNMLIKETRLLNEKKAYISSLKEVISVKKIAILFKSERRFRRNVIKEVRKRIKKNKIVKRGRN